MTSWREHFAPIIAEVLQQHPEDGPDRRKALREAWPAGERKYHPYKVWLDEIAKQTGRKPRGRLVTNNIIPGHLPLPLEAQ